MSKEWMLTGYQLQWHKAMSKAKEQRQTTKNTGRQIQEDLKREEHGHESCTGGDSGHREVETDRKTSLLANLMDKKQEWKMYTVYYTLWREKNVAVHLTS